LKSSVSVVTVS